MRVTDPGTFMKEVVGTDGEFTADEISTQIRNVIVQEMSQSLAKSGIPVLDMAANTSDLAKVVGTAIAPTISNYGLSLPEFYIENISLPEEVEKVLDKRTSMGLAGDLGKYTQFNAAEGLGNPNSAMGATMGAAMGAGMGFNMGAQATATAAAPREAMASGRKRRDQGALWRGRSARTGGRWQPDARFPSVDGGSRWLESG
jgi:membrane protease subunit (stomatin/prohibitin family)